ncbi:uncharacterized protein CYBJADRAFT_15615 [Cyberlindnera jadinii NRRL Y-1542]|uniref:Uncharacterized protein n=1 Tax=Cyberlindnera jadinii (strain ATCC 18201 / CBS 1600 / BCRC 20928 / JCM 3617 / NBRC 0987 / NRRL Y-1542) TaxID=983966 RepID=A0A1E4RZ08_CYBJN|nr:hypothetical protein CYBJADRAFT_15615 [Cyberlindnera jadinii NRRL Y-1542]ODV72497.1 hypothetical protein CYBJADRAFT_15615 [Cyberlindnera jadinii NRRL Y-1542]
MAQPPKVNTTSKSPPVMVLRGQVGWGHSTVPYTHRQCCVLRDPQSSTNGTRSGCIDSSTVYVICLRRQGSAGVTVRVQRLQRTWCTGGIYTIRAVIHPNTRHGQRECAAHAISAGLAFKALCTTQCYSVTEVGRGPGQRACPPSNPLVKPSFQSGRYR